MSKIYSAGIDLGSTTAKLVIGEKTESGLDIQFSRYRRHHANITQTVSELLKEAKEELGDIDFSLAITGSAGLGVAERIGMPFVQEVVAAANLIKIKYPECRTFIEIGGEDSKIIFFDDKFRADMRMNGSCAGGTGAFIDQMAVLLDIPVEEFNGLAEQGTHVYPMASRCGVFAKTDVQSLLANNVPKKDIALSTFHAVALQVLSTLTRGRDIEPKILLAGGPLTFNSMLRKSFIESIGFNTEDFLLPENPELIPATGTALNEENLEVVKISTLLERLAAAEEANKHIEHVKTDIPAPFKNEQDYQDWKLKFQKYNVNRFDYKKGGKVDCILGIDSGSTTTKVVFMDLEGKVIFTHYQNNKGDALGAVKKGLLLFKKECEKYNLEPNIVQSAATGYGEGLIKAAYGLDLGVVETMAHFRAAKQFEPNVSFIFDIGGQDMKAMFIEDGIISDIQLNEACSSGCGSFIETFANNMNYPVADFAQLACTASNPYDLGTRCTVFMNTKVKQAMREGVPIKDIACGLSFSVIKNSLYKVLKLTDATTLGSKIFVQGGTFKNDSVLRALELLTEQEIIRPDIPELMGAYGSALLALDKMKEGKTVASKFVGLEAVNDDLSYERRYLQCQGCENHCQIVKLTFPNGNAFYTGNKCEKIFSNSTKSKNTGITLTTEKLDILFKRTMKPSKKAHLKIGIPRALNMFKNFPFWNTLLVESGFEVVLSDKSNLDIFESGVKSVMSENICFPAKLTNGHIMNLVDKGVDRIFYPHVVFEQEAFKDTVNTFNCPVVTGYPDVIKSSIDTATRFNIPLDNPPITFADPDLLYKQIEKYLRKLGVPTPKIRRAFKKAVQEDLNFQQKLVDRGQEIIKEAEEKNAPLIVLVGRPYHSDQLINHGVPELLTELGAYIVTEDAIPLDEETKSLKDVNVLTQWAYTNRIYNAAKWVAKHPNAQLVQLTSFGCGPDCVCVDETKAILDRAGKIYTAIKLDEVFNLGAAKIRLRSLLDALKDRDTKEFKKVIEQHSVDITKIDPEGKTIIVPYFSEFHSALIPIAFEGLGPKVVNLPRQNSESISYGIKNINNEMCYPAVLITGDIIKAFDSGMYDQEKTIVLMSSTGGQCRASNYVPLIKKALQKSGYGNVPVDIFSTKSFKTLVSDEEKQKILIKRMGFGMLMADPLSQMYLATRPREKNVGTAKKLQDKYFKVIAETVLTFDSSLKFARRDFKKCLKVLEQMVEDFNAVEVKTDEVPRIGLVGEIFVKYNGFAHMDVTEWMLDQGCEVIVPPLQGFFMQEFVNNKFNYRSYLKHDFYALMKSNLTGRVVNRYTKQVEKVMSNYKYHHAPHDLMKVAKKTEKITSLANQFGEGWLLTSDVISMLEDGVDSVVSVQPFGCLANHIIAKGVEKKLRTYYPNFQMLALDFDQSTSPVNIYNRLHFLVSSAKEEMQKKKYVK